MIIKYYLHQYIYLSERNAMTFSPQYYHLLLAYILHSKFVLSLVGTSLLSVKILKILVCLDEPFENYSES